MSKTHPPYALEYRHQVVQLVHEDRTPRGLAREYECSAQAIRNGVRHAERDVSEGFRRLRPPTEGHPDAAYVRPRGTAFSGSTARCRERRASAAGSRRSAALGEGRRRSGRRPSKLPRVRSS